MKKKKLRPWVKVSAMFMFGVFVVSQIFSIFNAMASTEEQESRIIHGVIQLDTNGESHLSILELDFEGDITVDRKKGYEPCEIISVVMEGNKIVNHYKTDGEELRVTMDKHEASISTIRRNVVEAIYE